jgi:hypothetical protein
MKQLLVFVLYWSLLSIAKPAPSSIEYDLANPRVGEVKTRVDALPHWLQAALARTFKQKKLYLGNPNDPLAEELLIEGQREYPARRLLFAFESSSYYTVYVEYGLPTVHASVLVFDKPGPKRTSGHLVWGAADLRRPFARDRTALLDRIKRATLFERPGLIW